MQIRLAGEKDKQAWENFLKQNAMGHFLQSWNWAEFQQSLNNKIYKFIVEDKSSFVAVIFLYKNKLKLGQSFLYAPKGPVLMDGLSQEAKQEALNLIFAEIDKIAKQEKIMLLQIDPQVESLNWVDLLDDFGFVKSDEDMQPKHTLILDIRQSEEDLLQQMHQKTRYNIRLAEKKGVAIQVDNLAIKDFLLLKEKTESRQNITSFSENYFNKLVELPFAKLYLAKYDDKIISANIMINYGDTVTYLFGASDYEYRNIMAPYLLQWQAIKDAKTDNKYFYDFWGAAPKEADGREKNWSGFTKFKMGFSPNAEITEYIGTYEKIYLPVKLGLYRFLRKTYKR